MGLILMAVDVWRSLTSFRRETDSNTAIALWIIWCLIEILLMEEQVDFG